MDWDKFLKKYEKVGMALMAIVAIMAFSIVTWIIYQMNIDVYGSEQALVNLLIPVPFGIVLAIVIVYLTEKSLKNPMIR